MTQYKYVIKRRCAHKISAFYRNVSKKYKHAYSLEQMEQNVQDAYLAMFQIEHTLLRREPTLSRWAGYHMANKGNWYYAYVIDGDTITVVDACHTQNMHE